MLKHISVLSVLMFFLLALAGCVAIRPAALTPEMMASSGLAFASVSRIEGLKNYSGYHLMLRSVESGKSYSLTAPDSDLIGGPDEIVDGMVRILAVEVLPPGRYEHYETIVYLVAGYSTRTWTFSLKEPSVINVEAGKAYYVGAHVFIPTIRDFAFGLNGIFEPFPLLFSNTAADTTLAKRIYPNFPEVEVVDWVPKAMYEVGMIFDAAKVINPEKDYWDAEVWEQHWGHQEPENTRQGSK